jgi:hypothetical protein
MKISGLDQFARQLDDAQKALAALGGELATVKFNPHDPCSIEAAIKHIETTVDDRAGAYASNPIVGPLIEKMKENYCQTIIERAAAARLTGDEANG